MRLPHLFPEHHFEVETSWPTTVAAIEIRKRIAAPRGPSQGDEPFLGRSLSNTEFRFSPASSHRNDMLPVIEATVSSADPKGARIHVQVRLSDAMLCFTVVTMAVATLGLAATVSGWQAGFSWLGVSALLLVGCKLHHGTFKREARRTEEILRDIFAAAPALPPPPETGEPYR